MPTRLAAIPREEDPPAPDLAHYLSSSTAERFVADLGALQTLASLVDFGIDIDHFEQRMGYDSKQLTLFRYELLDGSNYRRNKVLLHRAIDAHALFVNDRSLARALMAGLVAPEGDAVSAVFRHAHAAPFRSVVVRRLGAVAAFVLETLGSLGRVTTRMYEHRSLETTLWALMARTMSLLVEQIDDLRLTDRDLYLALPKETDEMLVSYLASDSFRRYWTGRGRDGATVSRVKARLDRILDEHYTRETLAALAKAGFEVTRTSRGFTLGLLAGRAAPVADGIVPQTTYGYWLQDLDYFPVDATLRKWGLGELVNRERRALRSLPGGQLLLPPVKHHSGDFAALVHPATYRREQTRFQNAVARLKAWGLFYEPSVGSGFYLGVRLPGVRPENWQAATLPIATGLPDNAIAAATPELQSTLTTVLGPKLAAEILDPRRLTAIQVDSVVFLPLQDLDGRSVLRMMHISSWKLAIDARNRLLLAHAEEALRLITRRLSWTGAIAVYRDYVWSLIDSRTTIDGLSVEEIRILGSLQSLRMLMPGYRMLGADVETFARAFELVAEIERLERRRVDAVDSQVVTVALAGALSVLAAPKAFVVSFVAGYGIGTVRQFAQIGDGVSTEFDFEEAYCGAIACSFLSVVQAMPTVVVLGAGTAISVTAFASAIDEIRQNHRWTAAVDLSIGLSAAGLTGWSARKYFQRMTGGAGFPRQQLPHNAELDEPPSPPGSGGGSTLSRPRDLLPGMRDPLTAAEAARLGQGAQYDPMDPNGPSRPPKAGDPVGRLPKAKRAEILRSREAALKQAYRQAECDAMGGIARAEGWLLPVLPTGGSVACPLRPGEPVRLVSEEQLAALRDELASDGEDLDVLGILADALAENGDALGEEAVRIERDLARKDLSETDRLAKQQQLEAVNERIRARDLTERARVRLSSSNVDIEVKHGRVHGIRVGPLSLRGALNILAEDGVQPERIVVKRSTSENLAEAEALGLLDGLLGATREVVIEGAVPTQAIDILLRLDDTVPGGLKELRVLELDNVSTNVGQLERLLDRMRGGSIRVLRLRNAMVDERASIALARSGLLGQLEALEISNRGAFQRDLFDQDPPLTEIILELTRTRNTKLKELNLQGMKLPTADFERILASDLPKLVVLNVRHPWRVAVRVPSESKIQPRDVALDLGQGEDQTLMDIARSGLLNKAISLAIRSERSNSLMMRLLSLAQGATPLVLPKLRELSLIDETAVGVTILRIIGLSAGTPGTMMPSLERVIVRAAYLDLEPIAIPGPIVLPVVDLRGVGLVNGVGRPTSRPDRLPELVNIGVLAEIVVAPSPGNPAGTTRIVRGVRLHYEEPDPR